MKVDLFANTEWGSMFMNMLINQINQSNYEAPGMEP